MITSIVIPVIIVSSIGVLSGVILSVASIVLATPVNEMQEAVREVLPGANCGACGYAGCDGYAAALAEGDVPLTKCIPGGAAVKDQLSEILGVQAGDFRPMGAFVKCGGDCDSEKVKLEYVGCETCHAANQMFAGPGACTYGCIGFGDCVTVCEYDAISVINDVAVVDRDKCVGCSKCIAKCPKNIIELAPIHTVSAVACSNSDKGARVREACSAGCIGCMKCQKVCPEEAITVVNFLAVVDYDKCNGCGLCAENCTVSCITVMK